TRARFPVLVTFNGVAYRGSTMPIGDGTFCVGVTRAVQARAGASVGDRVAVVVERDAGERTVDGRHAPVLTAQTPDPRRCNVSRPWYPPSRSVALARPSFWSDRAARLEA